MGLFDQLQSAANELKSDMSNLGSVVMPQELLNMQQAQTDLEAKIAQVTQDLQTNPQEVNAISGLRTFLQSHFGHLEQGGDPEPSLAAKANPLYGQLKAKYAALDQGVRALEMQYLNCSFGYQMSDGSIQIPTTEWTEEQWHEIKDQSLNQVARCWKKDDPSQYVA